MQKREAIWVLSNLCSKIHDPEVLNKFIKSDVITVFYDVLLNDDLESGQVLLLCLSGLENLFSKIPNAKNIFERIGG